MQLIIITHGVEIFWKDTVSSEFWANHPKLCRNCAFPQNFHIKELGEISVVYAVIGNFIISLSALKLSSFNPYN